MTETAAPARVASDLPTFDNAQAWYGPDMAKRDEWIHTFTADEIADIDHAVRHAEASGRDIVDLRTADFPLRAPMRTLLDRVKRDALHGRGFVLMRGIPVEAVKTVVTFDTDASFPKLKFGFGGYIDEETQAHVDGLFGSDGVKEVTGEVSGSAHQEAVAAPAPKPVLVRPATPPAPPPPPPEPVVPKRGFGAKAAPAPAAAPAAAPVAIAAPKPVAKPKKAAEPAAPAGASLADEIASLIGSMEADDE
jgi:hypothetical protein